MSLMLDEIAEQPAALERTLKAERSNLVRAIRRLNRDKLGLIVLVARGTSDNAALFARYLLEITTGIPVSLSAPSIYTIYDRKLALKNALVVGISQSGEGTDINVVLESCRASGAHVFAITNNARSPMAAIAHEAFRDTSRKRKQCGCNEDLHHAIDAHLHAGGSLARQRLQGTGENPRIRRAHRWSSRRISMRWSSVIDS